MTSEDYHYKLAKQELRIKDLRTIWHSSDFAR